ncbi:MAG: DUF3597 domain-containing protein [Nitrospira sp.]
MGLFGTILEKLGFGGAAAQASPTAAPQAEPAQAQAAPQPAAPPPAKASGSVDVVAKLGSLAAKHKEKLNWRTSIVDLLKLLGLDSSLTARKELATELGCPTDKMNDSAQMNMWLHKTVMKKLADNGGNIPKELLS